MVPNVSDTTSQFIVCPGCPVTCATISDCRRCGSVTGSVVVVEDRPPWLRNMDRFIDEMLAMPKEIKKKEKFYNFNLKRDQRRQVFDKRKLHGH